MDLHCRRFYQRLCSNVHWSKITQVHFIEIRWNKIFSFDSGWILIILTNFSWKTCQTIEMSYSGSFKYSKLDRTSKIIIKKKKTLNEKQYFDYSSKPDELYIQYPPSILVVIDGLSLYQMLKVCREHALKSSEIENNFQWNNIEIWEF